MWQVLSRTQLCCRHTVSVARPVDNVLGQRQRPVTHLAACVCVCVWGGGGARGGGGGCGWGGGGGGGGRGGGGGGGGGVGGWGGGGGGARARVCVCVCVPSLAHTPTHTRGSGFFLTAIDSFCKTIYIRIRNSKLYPCAKPKHGFTNAHCRCCPSCLIHHFAFVFVDLPCNRHFDAEKCPTGRCSSGTNPHTVHLEVASRHSPSAVGEGVPMDD